MNMENMAEIMDPGMDADSLPIDVSNLFNPIESIDEEQKEKPAELKMIDGGIGTLANEVGDGMKVTESSETKLVADLSFLGGTETKETDLSYLDGSETKGTDLSYLDDSETKDAELSYLGSSDTKGAELSYLDGSDTKGAELSYLDGSDTKGADLAYMNGTEIKETGLTFLDGAETKEADLSFLDGAETKEAGLAFLDGAVTKEPDLSFLDGADTKETGLAFLDGAETKETNEEDDPGLSFLVSSGKMEVASEDLDFLEGHNFSEADSYSEDESYSNDDSEDETEGSSESDDSGKDDGEDKNEKKEDEDDGVYGQVSFYDDESASSNSLDVQKLKKQKTERKMKRKKTNLKRKTDGNSEARPAKRRRRRKKKQSDGDDDNTDDDVPKTGTGVMRRKNIRSIFNEKDLDKEMLSAQNEELERQKRLMELKKSLLRENAAAGSAATSSTVATSTTGIIRTISISAGTATAKEKDAHIKSLLQVAEEEAKREAENKMKRHLDKEVVKVKKEIRDTSPPSDVITLSSDSEESDDFDDDDDDSDDVVMVPSDEGEDEEDESPEDVNNGGAHINDTLNLPDPDGRVKINIGHPAEDPDVYLAPQIAQAIKPHQIGGVRFLYDNLVESLERFRTSPGFGCILAHSMGLGKTIQLISFIDIFIRSTGAKRVLCIVPINTLQNWLAEFNYWLPPAEKLHPDDNLTQTRMFPLFVINDSMKTMASRAAVIEKWKDTGGVLVMGYEMFRLLSSKKVAPSRAKSRAKKAKLDVIDVEEEDKNKNLMIDMHSTLVDPGPDLVMCDEGHRIKNSGAAISQALKSIKTRRRVVLTGYPLQNNLMEYWCMVDFVRPNFLGTKTEFSNMFERPIMNGQCVDSTASDKKIMRHRSYVLHNLLEGFVQRRGHTVLQLSLPPKIEHVFLVRLSPIQRKIYCEFMRCISESGLCSWANNNPLKAFAVCCKIWNHPDILHEVLTKHIADKDNDLDIDTVEGPGNKRKRNLRKTASSVSLASTADSTPSLTASASTTSLTSMASESVIDKNPILYDWAEPLMQDYAAGVLENSGKFMLMLSLVEECLAVGDKVLIFSQSLLTLNKIEEFVAKMKVPRPEINENWQRNKTYFRLDGSTSAQDREKLINQFNDPESGVWMFLLSTKAGCLGINLIAANRVIVVDASWNPCHDCQAICRVYRFGQVKNSYIYRLITDNTLEKKIYDRQINKQGMSDRIVDDMNPENKLTRRQVENLLDFEDIDFPVPDFSNSATKYGQDTVMQNVLKNNGQWLSKQPFTHESLLIDHKELRLSKREKRLAKEGYARDKRMNLTYTRPLYAAYHPQIGGIPNRLPLNSRYNYAAFRRGPIVRPIASVRPMIIANSQNGADKIKQFGGQPLRPGVTIHQVITTTEILLPGTNTGTQAGNATNKIASGQKILVIKTPKGVYIRTDDGKMFAVRSKSGASLGDVGEPSVTTTTTTTATLSSAGQNQVFITPNMGMAGPGGKKPPIIIVSNKKGGPITMARGGNIIRTLPYGSSNLLTSLKPSLLKAGMAKMTDSTTTTSSLSTKLSIKPSPSSGSLGMKGTSLADLIAGDDDMGREKNIGDGAETKPKMPVIVLPSLAIRTPRPLSSIQPSPAATASSVSETFVIMPTKPVISMGTKRAPKNPKPRKGKAKDVDISSSVGVGTDMSIDTTRKRGLGLLSGMMLVTSTSTISTSTISTSTIGSSTSGTSATDSTSSTTKPEQSQTSTFDTTQASTFDTTQASTFSTAQTSTFDIPQTSLSIQKGGKTTQRKQKLKQPMKQPFPDLNSMWENNFGAAPSLKSQASPSPLASQSSVGTNPTNINFGEGMMMPNKKGDPVNVGQGKKSEAGITKSSQNPNLIRGDSQQQNQNARFNNQFNMSNSQGYNDGSSPYLSGPISPFGMGSPPGMGSGDSHIPSYMLHQGFMPSSSGSFSQSLNLPPSQIQDQPQSGGNIMYSSIPHQSPSQFSSSFGSSNQQNTPSFGKTSSGGTFEDSGNPSSFGYNPNIGGVKYGAPAASSSFMSPLPGNRGFLPADSPFYPSQDTSPLYSMDMSNNSNNFPAQSQHHQLSMSPSLSLASTTPTLQDSGLMSLDRSISSPIPSPRHSSDTPDSNKNFMDMSNSRSASSLSKSGSSISQGFGSSSQDMLAAGNNFSFTNTDSSGPNSLNSNSGGFSMSTTSTLTPTLSGHSLGSDIGMGGSTFRSHHGSPGGMPAKPQPFRPEKASLGGGGHPSGLNYNSGMSAFSSPNALGGGGSSYGNSSSFGAYGPSYGGGVLPLSSSTMMPPPPQGMVGYSQPSLGYPSMSSLMMGAPPPPAAPTMGGPVWPMMPPSMMVGGYSYPTHPSTMGFSSGFDGQSFGHLGPSAGDNYN